MLTKCIFTSKDFNARMVGTETEKIDTATLVLWVQIVDIDKYLDGHYIV